MQSNKVCAASEQSPVEARSPVAAQQPSMAASCAAHRFVVGSVQLLLRKRIWLAPEAHFFLAEL
jgi:hypothetical protein